MDQGEIPTPSGTRGIIVASGLSAQTDPVKAAAAACNECLIHLGGAPCDLAFVFFTSHHVERAADISAKVRTRLRATHTIGVSAESVAGGTTELERTPGLSILALSLPGARLSAFTSDSFPPLDATEPEHVAVLSGGIGAATDTAAVFVFADPFSIPALQLIPALNKARQRDESGKPAGIVFGGLASAARAPGGNALFHNDRVLRFGAVGITISGPVVVDALVSQGCRPVAAPMVITKARNNLILQLGGRPARDVMREVVTEMNPAERAALSSGLFVGRVINEYKDRFGRSDFLIRAVVGEDPGSGAIAVADFVRVGQTVQFHVRDADTATQDLGLLLDAQRLHERPAGALLISCNGRGTRLFRNPNHDAEAVSRGFASVKAGEQLAKPGSMILPGAGTSTAWSSSATFPLAGFFASGEIGPVGTDSYLHGNTACVAMFRERK